MQPTSDRRHRNGHKDGDSNKVRPRPFYLIQGINGEGPLKHRLMQCTDGPFRARTSPSGTAARRFSSQSTPGVVRGGSAAGCGHRRVRRDLHQGRSLVCRHAENDLHTTTNILVTPLAAKCTRPFTPATFDSERQPPDAGQRGMPRFRPHPRRVQDAHRKDGRVQSQRAQRPQSSWAAPRRGALICTPAAAP